MLNYNDILVFDFETGSTSPDTCEVLQLAATVIDARTLNIKPNSEFNSLIKPVDEKQIQAKALEINKLKLEDLRLAPNLNVVWNSFVGFIKKFNKKGSVWSAPIAAGHNIKGFDMPIIERLCKQFGNIDKDGKNNIFYRRNLIDLLDMCFPWFENNKDVPDYKLDTLREYLGISKEGSHNAIVDVRDTANIISRFLRFHRNVAAKTVFKGKFN